MPIFSHTYTHTHTLVTTLLWQVLSVYVIDLEKAMRLKDDLEKKVVFSFQQILTHFHFQMFVVRKRDLKDMKCYKKPVGLVVPLWQAVLSRCLFCSQRFPDPYFGWIPRKCLFGLFGEVLEVDCERKSGKGRRFGGGGSEERVGS